MTDPFGTYRCTSSKQAHYYLDGAERPLCGAKFRPWESAAYYRPADRLRYRMPLCEACKKANEERWARAGEASR